MQFDIDMHSSNSTLFTRLRDILLSYEAISEKKNEKQTSFYDAYSAVCFLRGREHGMVISLAKGAKLQDKYPFLQGDGKVARYFILKDETELDGALFREIIEETMMLNLETHEQNKIKKQLMKGTK